MFPNANISPINEHRGQHKSHGQAIEAEKLNTPLHNKQGSDIAPSTSTTYGDDTLDLDAIEETEMQEVVGEQSSRAKSHLRRPHP